MRIEKFKSISATAKHIAKSYEDMKKYSIKSADFSLSEAQRGKARENANYLGSHIEIQIHELHCLCVELGIADYDSGRYGDRIHIINGWTEHKINFRQPKL